MTFRIQGDRGRTDHELLVTTIEVYQEHYMGGNSLTENVTERANPHSIEEKDEDGEALHPQKEE